MIAQLVNHLIGTMSLIDILYQEHCCYLSKNYKYINYNQKKANICIELRNDSEILG